MSFEVQVEQLDAIRRRLVVQVPASEVAGEIESAVRQLARTARVPGFRPGKVPRAVLEKRYGERVQADVCERLMRESLVQALEQEHIHPVGPPQIVTEAGDGDAGLRYSVTVEVIPEVTARDYHAIPAERPLRPVSEAAVDELLEGWRQRQAQLQPIEGRDRAEVGDVVQVDIEGETGGRALHRSEGRHFELGSAGIYPEIDAALRGATVGSVVEAEVEFPADHSDRSLAGQKASLRLQVRGLARKVVPDLDDEFAKDVSDCADLAELRARIRTNMEAEARRQADAAARAAVLDELLRRHADVEAPRAMVESRLEAMVEDVREQWKGRGVWPASDRDLLDRLRAEFEERARDQVRLGLVLSAVARQESIALEDQELDDAVEAIVAGEEDAERADLVRRAYGMDAYRTSLRRRLLQDKVTAFLMAQAQVTTVEKENDVADANDSD